MITINQKLYRKCVFDNLPKCKYSFIILPDGRKTVSGDIIVRPMYDEIPFVFEHFGFVWGTSQDGKKYMIDMNKKEGVRCVTIEKFMEGHNSYRIQNKPFNTTIDEIIQRAKEWKHVFYDFFTGNCQQFTNYSVHGDRRSLPIEFLKGISDTLLRYVEYRLQFNNEESAKNLIKEIRKLRSNLKLNEYNIQPIGVNKK